MDEFDEMLDDALTDETEGYTPKNKKINPFLEEMDFDYEDEYEWDEE